MALKQRSTWMTARVSYDIQQASNVENLSSFRTMFASRRWEASNKKYKKNKNVKNHHPPSFVFFILLVFCRSYMACTILNCMFSPSQLEQHSRRIVCRVKDKPIYCPSHNHDLLRTWGHRWLHQLNVLYIRMIHNISILYYYIGRVAIGHLIFL